ncbi:hypothetical protein BT96DRAFT_840426 [Gymnopus androsaceus JB14]|uniref:Uncharacterized protein n=1 Tax=Gymnopus androsaceus JB14 TaxID=1447944 RepID=A0A6A4GK32_9AGAR|nr:hypothetical protein BT96DRAFT_840426 [Gymnopus androsaceus JB14]
MLTSKFRQSRQRAIDDQARRHGNTFNFHDYEEGMYVWLRESQLETTKGNKTDWTYSGPFIIHSKRDNGSYVLRELDGSLLHGHVNAQRLRLFYFRPENQTLRSRIPTRPKPKPTGKVTSISYSSIYSSSAALVHQYIQEEVRREARDALNQGQSRSGALYRVISFDFIS